MQNTKVPWGSVPVSWFSWDHSQGKFCKQEKNLKGIFFSVAFLFEFAFLCVQNMYSCILQPINFTTFLRLGFCIFLLYVSFSSVEESPDESGPSGGRRTQLGIWTHEFLWSPRFSSTRQLLCSFYVRLKFFEVWIASRIGLRSKSCRITVFGELSLLVVPDSSPCMWMVWLVMSSREKYELRDLRTASCASRCVAGNWRLVMSWVAAEMWRKTIVSAAACHTREKCRCAVVGSLVKFSSFGASVSLFARIRTHCDLCMWWVERKCVISLVEIKTVEAHPSINGAFRFSTCVASL